jgi:hypothetical protein
MNAMNWGRDGGAARGVGVQSLERIQSGAGMAMARRFARSRARIVRAAVSPIEPAAASGAMRAPGKGVRS